MIGTIVSGISSLLGEVTLDKDKAKELEFKAKQLEAQILSEHTKAITKITEEQSSIIKGEMTNGSGQWRPRLMNLFMGMIAVHFLLAQVIPYFVFMFDFNVILPEVPKMDDRVMDLLEMGLGGYIGARSLEKVAITVADKFKK